MKIEAEIKTGAIIDSLLLNYEYEEIQHFIMQIDFMIGDPAFTEDLIEGLQRTLEEDDDQEVF